MISQWFNKIFGASWKTSLAGYLVLLASVPSMVTAVQAWVHHQPADWRSAIFGIAIAIIGRLAQEENVTPPQLPQAPSAK